MEVRQMVNTMETAIALTGLYYSLAGRFQEEGSQTLTRPNQDVLAKANVKTEGRHHGRTT